MWNRVKNVFASPRAGHERLSESPSEAEPIGRVMASRRRDAEITTSDAMTEEAEAKAKAKAKVEKAKRFEDDLKTKGFI